MRGQSRTAASRETIMLLTAGNRDVDWRPVRIGHGAVDFCRQPFTRTSKAFADTSAMTTASLTSSYGA